MKIGNISRLTERYSSFEKEYKHIICYVYGLLSAVFLTTTNFLVKALPNLTSSEVLFFQSVFLFSLTKVMMDAKKMGVYYPDLKVNRLLFSRGVLGCLGMSLNYYGLKLVPLSEASVIAQTLPAVVGIFAIIFLKEKYTLSQFFGTVFCFCGVIFVVKPNFLFHLDEEKKEETNSKFIGIVALLSSTIFLASTQILVKKIASKTNEGITTLYYAAIASMLSPLISFEQGFNAFSFNEFLVLLLIGGSSFLSQIFRNKAYILGNPGKISIMSYFGILFSIFIDVYILGSDLDFYSMIGAIFIFSSLFVFLYRTIQQEKKQKEEL